MSVASSPGRPLGCRPWVSGGWGGPTFEERRPDLGEADPQEGPPRAEPGAHEISVGDPRTGARVVFGTKVGTILTRYGGCFLQAGASGP